MNLLKYCLGVLTLLPLLSTPMVQAGNPNCEQIRATYQCPAEKKKITLSFDDGVADDNVMNQMCSGKGRQGVVLFHDGDFEKEHAGRPFTANNLARWIPMLRCAADFVPLTHFKKNLRVK